MWSFVLGLLAGLAAKAVYDLFKEEQLPAAMGLNAGRIEALLDDTRQAVSDLRQELRQAMSGEGTLQEKAGRVLSAATETVGGGRTGATGDSGQGEEGQAGLKLTSNEPTGGSGQAGGAQGAGSGGQQQSSGGSVPPATHGTIQTMS